MEKYGVDAVLGLLAIVRARKIHISVADEPGWFSLTVEESIMYELGYSRIRGAFLPHIQ